MHLTGLTEEEATRKLAEYGDNQLPKDREIPLIILFLKQFKNFFTLILSVAAVISIWQHSFADGILIFLILLLNATLSFWQEYKSSKEMKALRSFSEPTSRVIRGGTEKEIQSIFLVPEDIVILESGTKVPADGIILDAHSLSVDESALTGESTNVYKSKNATSNQLYYSSTVLSGKAFMRVTSTGLKTKFGQTISHLQNLDEEITPLEKSLNVLAKNIGFVILGIALFLFLISLLQGKALVESIFTSIALFVAAVPEGLPAVITVILALGVRRLYSKKTLVRRMGSVESLGSTNIICTDKTGTLTKNEMRVENLYLFKENLKEEFVKTSVICNNSSLILKDSGKFDILGDTTEGALLIWCNDNNVKIDNIKESGTLLEELPFDSKNKLMAVTFSEKNQIKLYAKGAVESILPKTNLTQEEKEKVLSKNNEFAKSGLRVLALASKETTSPKIELSNLSFLGLVGIADGPREGVGDVIKTARRAGIEVVMITGDNPITATAVAKKIGLLKEGEEVITGDQLDTMSDIELTKRLDKIRIYARTSPEHKIRIVTAFQSIGKIVAVTGDGVNDALALKKSNIGVSMGITGTDVAKEASDLILLNDNFSTLVDAIEQGRNIYSNIVKCVRFLFASNLSEVVVVTVIVMLGSPVPLLPVQLLWINLVSDSLPALSLSASKSEKGIMNKAPRDSNEPILTKSSIYYIIFGGILIGMINILLFYFSLSTNGLTAARDTVFLTIVISQMIFAFVVSGRKNLFENKYLLASTILIVFLQIAIMSLPFTRALFKL